MTVPMLRWAPGAITSRSLPCPVGRPGRYPTMTPGSALSGSIDCASLATGGTPGLPTEMHGRPSDDLRIRRRPVTRDELAQRGGDAGNLVQLQLWKQRQRQDLVGGLLD